MDTHSYTGYSHFLIDASQNSITITLPSFVYDGEIFTFIRTDTSANSVTFIPSTPVGSGSTTDPGVGYTIGGHSFASLTPKQMTTLIAMGNDWICPILTYTC